jgi:hypothetical protein
MSILFYLKYGLKYYFYNYFVMRYYQLRLFFLKKNGAKKHTDLMGCPLSQIEEKYVNEILSSYYKNTNKAKLFLDKLNKI